MGMTAEVSRSARGNASLIKVVISFTSKGSFMERQLISTLTAGRT